MGGTEGDARETGKFVTVGKVSGVFGVKGWIRVQSFTRPPDNLLRYQPWYIRAPGAEEWRRVECSEGRPHGNNLAVALDGIDDRDGALALKDSQIAVRRGQLPDPAPGEYYWFDLVGLRVETTAGHYLGDISEVRETGANEVLVVQGQERSLIPFLPGRVVKNVDLGAGIVCVDWEPGYQ